MTEIKQQNIKFRYIHHIHLLYLIGIITLLFAIGRILLYYSHTESFSTFPASWLFITFSAGLEYDVYMAFIVNAVFIIFYLLPLKYYNSNIYLSFLKSYYVIANALCLLFNLLDINYYAINLKRMDINNFLPEIKNILISFKGISYQDFINNYLLITVSWIIFLVILSYSIGLVKPRKNLDHQPKNPDKYIAWVVVSVLLGFMVNFFASKPVFFQNIFLKTNRQLIPLLVNNPYIMLQTSRYDFIETDAIWDDDTYQSGRQKVESDSLQSNTIRLILIEGTEDNSFITSFKDAGSNVAISNIKTLNISRNSIYNYLDEMLLGFPAILTTNFYQSVYSLNKFQSLPNRLQKQGYLSLLIVYGYDNKNLRIIRNFYGFNNDFIIKKGKNTNLPEGLSQINDYKSGEKRFELYLMNFQGESNDNIKKSLNQMLTSFVDSLPGKQSTNLVYLIPGLNKSSTPKIDKSLFVITEDKSKALNINDAAIFQPLDFITSVLDLVNDNELFIAYGSSIFTNEDKDILITAGPEFYLLKDSLLLEYSGNSANNLSTLKQSGFIPVNDKDSLVVERVQMENTIQSIKNDYFRRLIENRLNQ